MEAEPSHDDLNPYETPKAEATPPTVTSGNYFRDADQAGYLILRDGAELPGICIFNGCATTPEDPRKDGKVYWNPQWSMLIPIACLLGTITSAFFIGELAFLLLIGSVLVFLVTIGVAQKRAKFTYSYSQAHKNRLSRSRLIGCGFIVIGMTLLILHIAYDLDFIIDFAGLVWLLPFVIGLVMTVKINNSLNVTAYRNGWFRVKGASKEFLKTLPEHHFSMM